MKKIVIVLISLFLLCSCATKYEVNESDPQALYYLNKLENFEVLDKNLHNQKDDEAFALFELEAFKQTMSLDFLNMHYTVRDYRALDIEKPAVNLGNFKYSFNQQEYDLFNSQLSRLQAFDYDNLSYKQQYDYQALEYSLYETLTGLFYYQYNSLLSKANNVPSNIYNQLSDYIFYDVESIDDYLMLLKDVQRALDEIMEYTNLQAQDGYGPIDSWIDYTIDACDGFTNKIDDNALILTFGDRLDSLDFLSDKEKESYKKENERIVKEQIIPSYRAFSLDLAKYKGKVDNQRWVLCNLDPNYARYFYMIHCSNNVNIDDILKELEIVYNYYDTQYLVCMLDDTTSKLEESFNNDLSSTLNMNDQDCLEYLRKNMQDYYPILENIEYQIQVLDPDVAPESVIAYYYLSPVDNINQNNIYVNPNNISQGFEAYGTLAHEGFPGHLYHTAYYRLSDPSPLRSAIGFSSYDEGIALLASKDAYYYCGVENSTVSDTYYFLSNYYFYLYSICDLLVNYYGYSLAQLQDYLLSLTSLFDFSNKANVQLLYNVAIENAGTYCLYGAGAAHMEVLKEKAKDKMQDDFNIKEFNIALMNNGPLPMALIDQELEEYITSIIH